MTDAPAADPGLEGVVPFRFACHRCGHCCTAGEGATWVEQDELEPLAAAVGMTREAFVARCVRELDDPTTGLRRLALRTRIGERPGAGACVLLEGANHCTAYTARPRHCRTFPYWDGVLSDPAAFERARAVCPGIAVEPDPETRARAFAELEELYAEVDALVRYSESVCLRRGVCCRFEEAGHELWATALEADYAAERHPEAPPPEAPGRCPYHRGGRCTAREGRPLGCRTYFCDVRTQETLARAHEDFLARVRHIERSHGYPAAYARFPELLAARGVGLAPADEAARPALETSAPPADTQDEP